MIFKDEIFRVECFTLSLCLCFGFNDTSERKKEEVKRERERERLREGLFRRVFVSRKRAFKRKRSREIEIKRNSSRYNLLTYRDIHKRESIVRVRQSVGKRKINEFEHLINRIVSLTHRF